MDVRFVWQVPESGHEWKRHKGEQRLTWKEERKGGFSNNYVPKIGLFREFAALPTTRSKEEAAILRFANKYGDIVALPGSSFYGFVNEEGVLLGVGGPGAYNRKLVRGHASLRTWRNAIQHIRRAVNLWDQMNDERTGKAARSQAHTELQAEVEAALKDTTTPSCARVRLNQKSELLVQPVNLLAFMWLTVARLVSGEIVEQPCVGQSARCLGYIYTGSGGLKNSGGLKKTGTATCGVACRKRKSRNEASL